MNKQTTASQNLELVRFEFATTGLTLNWLESFRKRGRHTSIEAMVNKVLTIYWKTISRFGQHANTVQLWWPHNDWGDGEAYIELDYYFRAKERITSVSAQEPAVRTFTIDVTQVTAERIRWTMASVGASRFADLIELAIGFYGILLDYGNRTERGGWHLRIKKEVQITKRRWLLPWKTYQKKVWHNWIYFRVHDNVLTRW